MAVFISLLSRWIGAWFSLALPAYATYKALRTDQPLQHWATHWVVVGAFFALEQSIGPFVTWLPFYWELRTFFLLYVSLPQTQGAAYVYKACLEPWLSNNEADLDTALASAQSNTIAFCRARFSALVDLVSHALNNPSGDPQNPASADHLRALWTTYAPSFLAVFATNDTSDRQVAQPHLQN